MQNDARIAPGISREDLGALTLCAFRYALGRQSYMPDLIAGVIRRAWDYVPERDRLLVEVELNRAVNDHLRNDRDLGPRDVVAVWRKLAEDLNGR